MFRPVFNAWKNMPAEKKTRAKRLPSMLGIAKDIAAPQQAKSADRTSFSEKNLPKVSSAAD